MESLLVYSSLLEMEAFPETSFPHGSCITIGVFDGVHLGHQYTLQKLVEKSIHYTLPAIVFIIDPHPKKVLNSIDIPLLTLIESRASLILHYTQKYAKNAIPIYCIRVPFTQKLASYTAHQFIEEVISPFCSVHHIILGESASFGNDKCHSLRDTVDYSIEYTTLLHHDKDIISSTTIRHAISSGDMDTVRRYLGRYYSFSGFVVHGYKRGSTLLGFPTANITLPEILLPSQGVYAVYVYYKGVRYRGVMNIGTNPTFAGRQLSLEVHIIDFSLLIYGEHIFIEFCTKLRNEQHFNNITDLIQQIKSDIEQTRNLLSL